MKFYKIYKLGGKDLFLKIEGAEELFRQTFPNQPQNIPWEFFEENMKHINRLMNFPANHHNMQGFPKNIN